MAHGDPYMNRGKQTKRRHRGTTTSARSAKTRSKLEPGAPSRLLERREPASKELGGRESGRPGKGPTPAEAKVAVNRAIVKFGREVCGNFEAAEAREWLVTNGIGGYASGTISGNMTRRYHGLLIAALQPPVGRTLLCTKLDETARYDGAVYDLSTNRWVGGEVSPKGFVNIESFRLEGTTPVWQFAFGDALLEKRI